MAIRITKLPATKRLFTDELIGGAKTRRAAVYARVSSDHDDQLTSYAAQVEYYTDYIQKRADLVLAGVYTDEGITGTSTARREGFRKMIEDALAGKIDLIITKSVSRFARNTVDSLSAIRLLKEHGVECYFERENIRTFDGKCELLLSIMSGIAQEEARSVSQNCTWGQRKRFADGKAAVPFSRFLGYDRGADGGFVVNEKQAEVVRRIYALYLSGETAYGIAKILTQDSVPTPAGAERWSRVTVLSILTNEKYKGDALLQKVFTTDYLTKRKKRNEGEVAQYYVEGSHKGIISEEMFVRVQEEYRRRQLGREREEYFAPKLFCGKCGKALAIKLLYSSRGYRKRLWRCEGCEIPQLVAAQLRLIYIRAVGRLSEEMRAALAIERGDSLTEFCGELWERAVERVTIYSEKRVCVDFAGGESVVMEVPLIDEKA